MAWRILKFVVNMPIMPSGHGPRTAPRKRLGMNLRTLGSHLIMRRPYWVGLVALWAALTGLSYLWNVRTIEAYAKHMAVFRGRLVFEVIQASRVWEQGHGGDTRLSAQLVQAGQYDDLNPAAMTRQLDALLARETDMRVRLTSLKPLNPENAPEAWERGALLQFERGALEYIDHHDTPAQHQFRYMAPLKTLESCLPCHAQQGHRVGDVRGAMSISQDATRIMHGVATQLDNLRALHLGAFLLLAGVTWGSLTLIRRHIQTIESERDQRRRIAETLEEKVEELKRTQNELLLSEKQASLGRMVAGFAHEVNTPVGVAVGAASHAQEALAEIERLLSSEEVSEDDLRRQLSIIGESSELTLANLKRAAALVQSFKRTSVDQMSDNERDFEMAELIDDVLRSLHNVFKRTRIVTQVDCPARFKLHGPAGALEQILTNMMMNSFHHAYADGAQPGVVRIEARRLPGDQVALDFSDDGAGMNAEARGKVFEPFFTTRRGQGGSGLGLYIVYNLVTAKLGGTISCESEPGRGTRFAIAFPARGAQTLGNAR
jgi:signal transduction histidine kinase